MSNALNKITSDEVDLRMIRGWRDSAGSHGDEEAVKICDAAEFGEESAIRAEARELIADMENEVRAAQGDE